LGTIFGALLLAFGLIKNNEEVKLVSLAIFVIIAVLTLPVYFTGEPPRKKSLSTCPRQLMKVLRNMRKRR
jgi:hypothetical protein